MEPKHSAESSNLRGETVTEETSGVHKRQSHERHAKMGIG